MDEERLRLLQTASLRDTVARACDAITFYDDAFGARGLVSADVRDLDDLAELPFTAKDDLRAHYPLGFCAVPLEELARIHASSGTTGKPVIGLYTAEDMEAWVECMCRNLCAAGVEAQDLVQNAYGYGLFTGGLGFHQAAVRLGCTVLPTSSGLTERQIMLMVDLRSTVLCCTPSYALTLAERAEQAGVDPRALPLRVGVFGAEPWTVQMREQIEARLGITAMEAYGLTELCGPGVAFDCEARNGLHINEDHFLPEVIDPESLEPLGDGHSGELVLTSLQRRAMPLIRFRTRDITRLTREPCSCGRTLVRMDKVLGRSDDMLIIRGVNVFPSQVEALLVGIEQLEPHYRLVLRTEGHLDQLIVQVEPGLEVARSGDPGVRQSLVERAEAHLREVIAVRIPVELVERGSLPRSEGKAQAYPGRTGRGDRRRAVALMTHPLGVFDTLFAVQDMLLDDRDHRPASWSPWCANGRPCS